MQQQSGKLLIGSQPNLSIFANNNNCQRMALNNLSINTLQQFQQNELSTSKSLFNMNALQQQQQQQQQSANTLQQIIYQQQLINESVADSTNLNSANTAAASNAATRYKTELCRSFQETGNCKYSEKCQFSHGYAELRQMTRHPKYKTELCRTFHAAGYCPYGPRCHFVHEINALNNSNSSSNTPLISVSNPSSKMHSPKIINKNQQQKIQMQQNELLLNSLTLNLGGVSSSSCSSLNSINPVIGSSRLSTSSSASSSSASSSSTSPLSINHLNIEFVNNIDEFSNQTSSTNKNNSGSTNSLLMYASDTLAKEFAGINLFPIGRGASSDSGLSSRKESTSSSSTEISPPLSRSLSPSNEQSLLLKQYSMSSNDALNPCLSYFNNDNYSVDPTNLVSQILNNLSNQCDVQFNQQQQHLTQFLSINAASLINN